MHLHCFGWACDFTISKRNPSSHSQYHIIQRYASKFVLFKKEVLLASSSYFESVKSIELRKYAVTSINKRWLGFDKSVVLK